MQILIIQLPSGEQLSCLGYTLEGNETLIGRDSSCQILLPDRQQKVAGHHVRIFQEGDQWYAESLFEHEFRFNQSLVSQQQNQRMLLSDGDILTIGDYKLAISDFSPWKENQGQPLEPPELPSAEGQMPEFCLIPATDTPADPEQLNDPFSQWEHSGHAPEKESGEIEIDMRDNSESPLNTLSSNSVSNLIDVLAPQEDLNDDWSIHRTLWSGDLPESFPASGKQGIPVLSERVSPINQQHRKSVCHAMLEALEQTLEDFSPENLAISHQKNTGSPGKVRRYFSRKTASPEDNFQNKYRHFHQQIMKDKNYRLLFLQRFRQAMKDQE